MEKCLIMEITSKELKQKITNGEKILVDFYGKFCGPCKIMKPWFESASEELKKNNSDVSLYTFDIDTDKEFVVSQLGIRSVPTIKIYKEGEEVFSKPGIMTANEVLNLLND